MVDFSKLYSPHASQAPFHSSPVRYKLIGGAMGGGKSAALCAEAIQLSLDIPGNRGAILRKNLTVLKRTTAITFFQVCPSELIADFNKTEMKVTLVNGSEILFLEADESKDRLFEKLKSLELGWWAIDEASEVSYNAFKVLASRLRWKASGGKYYGLLASNPEQCWVKEVFIDDVKENHGFFPALPKDNPSLPPDYIDNLKLIFDEVQQRKYIEGDWNVSDDPMQIIPYTALKNCIIEDDALVEETGIDSLGVDVAELGEDKTALAYMRNGYCFEVETFAKKRIDEVSQIIKARIIQRKIDADRVGIDAVGNGAGVWGNLTGDGMRVQRIISGEAPLETGEPFQFANLKSQMWWTLRLDVLNPDSGFKIMKRQSLIQDITAPRYKIGQERKIIVEPKDDTKRRIGRSPDEGDALVICNWVRKRRTPAAASQDLVDESSVGDVRGYYHKERKRSW